MSAAVTCRWRDGVLEPRDDCDVVPAAIEAADSWSTTGGLTVGIALHRERFMAAIPRGRYRQTDPAAFWDAAIAAIPAEGDWFPRVELRSRLGAPELLFRLRPAPERRTTVRLVAHIGRDPRTAPRLKGPDLDAMLRLRTEARARGADEAVLLAPDGAVADGSTSAIAWWRDDAFVVPADDIDRIDSVTLRSVTALAEAHGVDVRREHAAPADLAGCEVWSLNALHGIRVVTEWIDGPPVAAMPDRADTWRERLAGLRRPVHEGMR